MKNILSAFILFSGIGCFGQEPIFATINGGDLYKVNLANCTTTFVGATGYGFGDIAFTPDGELWGMISGELYHIDTISANSTLIGLTGIGGVSLVGLNDSTLLTESDMKLYSINVNNGISTYIDTIGYQAIGDLTWYDDNLFMTSQEYLVRIVMNTTHSAILSVDTVNAAINPVPTCEGTATSTIINDYNSIIGFNGPNAYKICHLNGTFELLCPDLIPGGTPGAASIRLMNQVPQPAICSTVSINEIHNNTNLIVHPNPFSVETTIFLNEQFENVQLVICNSSGQIVMQQLDFSSQTITVPRNNLMSGLYFAYLTTENNQTTVFKLIITD